jgi:hypothetical protein
MTMYYSISVEAGLVEDDQCHKPIGATVYLQLKTPEAAAKVLESLVPGRNGKALRRLAALVRKSGPQKASRGGQSKSLTGASKAATKSKPGSAHGTGTMYTGDYSEYFG